MSLEINSLRWKKGDIMRQLINELAFSACALLLLVARRLAVETPGWSEKMLIDRQSLNHSYIATN